MNIFDRATEIQVRLQAASEADSSDELLSRSRTVRMELNEAAAFFEAVNSFRSALDTQDVPNININGVSSALGRFRGALSRFGSAAVQQQTATTLLETIKTETTRLDRWVKSIWKSRFDDVQSLLDREETGDLIGSNDHRKKARGSASRLRRARNTDPVRAPEELEKNLGATGFDACLKKIEVLGDGLRSAIEKMDQERAALTPEVQRILEKAGTVDGIPLSEITSEVLGSLEVAGVLDDLVVRRS